MSSGLNEVRKPHSSAVKQRRGAQHPQCQIFLRKQREGGGELGRHVYEWFTLTPIAKQKTTKPDRQGGCIGDQKNRATQWNCERIFQTDKCNNNHFRIFA
jgi:hypothetical protein